MLLEHGPLIVAWRRLVATVQEQSRLEIARSAETLDHHLARDKPVLHPAALVLGEHGRLRSAPPRTA